jgi:hypothetical protein
VQKVWGVFSGRCRGALVSRRRNEAGDVDADRDRDMDLDEQDLDEDEGNERRRDRDDRGE